VNSPGFKSAQIRSFRTGTLVKEPPNSAAHPEPLERRTLSLSSSRRPGGRERWGAYQVTWSQVEG